jgi:hypothetical protein
MTSVNIIMITLIATYWYGREIFEKKLPNVVKSEQIIKANETFQINPDIFDFSFEIVGLNFLTD